MEPISQGDFDRAVERMATDPSFASAVRANPVGALAGYDLTDRQRQDLSLMQTATVAETPAPAALATRRSKSSMLGIGTVAGVAAVGAATFGTIHYLQPSTPRYAEFISLNSATETGIYSVTKGVTTGGTGIGSAGNPTRRTVTYTVVRPEDNLSPQFAEDVSRGTLISTVTFRFESGGRSYRHITLTHVYFISDQASFNAGGDGQHRQTLNLVAETEQIMTP